MHVPVDELLTLLDDIRHAMDEFDLEKADKAMGRDLGLYTYI